MSVKDYIRGRTCFDQDFQIDIVKNKLSQKYDVYLVVISPFTSKYSHIKLNTKRMSYTDALAYSKNVANSLKSNQPDVNYNYGLPGNQKINLSKELITLVRLPADALFDPEFFLMPGDEIYVRCRALNVCFYHSGIYVGDGRVVHFMATLAENGSIFDLMIGPGQVHNDAWIDFVYSNLDSEPGVGVPPVIYKVGYPLAVRTGDQVVGKAVQMYSTQVKLTYDIKRNNCQHFSSYCSVGQAWSYDMSSAFKSMACSILEIGFASKKPTESTFFGSFT